MYIHLQSALSAFLDTPDNQRLTSPAVTGCEYSWYVGRVFSVWSLDVGAGVLIDAESGNELFLGTKETQSEEDKLGGVELRENQPIPAYSS